MIETCVVSGTIEDPTGSPASGEIVFTPDRFTDTHDAVIVVPVPISVGLAADGSFSVSLLFSHSAQSDVYNDVYYDSYLYEGPEAAQPAKYHVVEPSGDEYCIMLNSSLGDAVLLTDAPRC